jgi:predicted 3-demethylubiquinone-9 3-methyltransferase (glyoxalase superfamily)
MQIASTHTQKITPFLWFNNNAEEAMQFYTSVFKNATIENVSRYGKGGPGPEGSVITGTFQLEGQKFMALNGGPQFNFTPAISFFVNCETQAEIDELWDKLSEGGSKGRCGWLQDKFGVSWQIVPTLLGKLMQGPDRARAANVMQAMLQMNKLDMAVLQQAYDKPLPSAGKMETA